MLRFSPQRTWRGLTSSCAALALIAGCATGDAETPEPQDPQEDATGELGEITSAAIVGTFPDEAGTGQTLTIHSVASMSSLTSRLASCSAGVLYASRSDGTLWVNRTDGVGTWTQVSAGSPGTKIACDRLHIYALDSSNVLWHAVTRSDGQLSSAWSSSGFGVPAGTTEISSGLGNIYALAVGPSSSTLWSSALPDNLNNDFAQGHPSSWIQHASNLGSKFATGAGSLSLTTPSPYVSSRPENRVFGMNPDGTLFFNNTVLNGANWWTQLAHNGGFTNAAITADAPNILYGLRNSLLIGGSKTLYRYEFTEDDCTDGVDNDANGMMDAEDPVCRTQLATSWCATHTGSYCMRRIENTAGYNNTLVTCAAGAVQSLSAGVCTEAAGTGVDFLKPLAQIYTPEPANSGHYCNVIQTNGTWGFNWTGATPCATLLAAMPGATIVRAGIYSTTDTNSIAIKCTDGGIVWEAAGTNALATANGLVGHSNNKCVVTVSPKSMRVFVAPFPTNTWFANSTPGARGYRNNGHAFDHTPACQVDDANCPCGLGNINCPFDTASFGNASVISSSVDNRGLHYGNANSNSYDYAMAEGTPMRALGWGRVVVNGSRDRNIAGNQAGGTPYQGEVYIKYDIGSDPVYQESYVAYYAHLRRRSVVDGQTVAPGQIIGYSGTSGASSGPHLHFGLARVTNINATTGTTPAQLAYGYHVTYDANPSHSWGVIPATTTGMVDPYGWRAPAGIDPYGHHWARAKTYDGIIGAGAWGPQLWKTGEIPPFPF
jgi:murein DD-endopeptidase MepM/ murein hydrolase activator NlpD